MELPEKPLVAGMSTRADDINRVYFFERSDGQIIACEEQEAWSLYSRKVQILGRSKRQDFKLIGVGDGLIYKEALANARIAGRTDIAEAQRIIRQGQADELEACRGKIIPPRNMDTIQ